MRALGGRYGLSSYSAENLAGEPRVYPAYGDYTQAYVAGTYGPWWRDAPDAAPAIPLSDRPFEMKDFVELAFEVPVQPVQITILETSVAPPLSTPHTLL